MSYSFSINLLFFIVSIYGSVNNNCLNTEIDIICENDELTTWQFICNIFWSEALKNQKFVEAAKAQLAKLHLNSLDELKNEFIYALLRYKLKTNPQRTPVKLDPYFSFINETLYLEAHGLIINVPQWYPQEWLKRLDVSVRRLAKILVAAKIQHDGEMGLSHVYFDDIDKLTANARLGVNDFILQTDKDYETKECEHDAVLTFLYTNKTIKKCSVNDLRNIERDDVNEQNYLYKFRYNEGTDIVYKRIDTSLPSNSQSYDVAALSSSNDTVKCASTYNLMLIGAALCGILMLLLFASIKLISYYNKKKEQKRKEYCLFNDI